MKVYATGFDGTGGKAHVSVYPSGQSPVDPDLVIEPDQVLVHFGEDGVSEELETAAHDALIRVPGFSTHSDDSLTTGAAASSDNPSSESAVKSDGKSDGDEKTGAKKRH